MTKLQIETHKELDAMCAYLTTYNFKLSENHADGRVNSIHNEDELIVIIKEQFDILDPSARNWADMHLINYQPVNIKATTTHTADNASSKKGLYYAMTGEEYKGGEAWPGFLKALKANMKDTDKDYYFLIANKETGEVTWNSIKGVNTLTPNGSNLPFQIRWDKNKEYVQKSFEDVKKMVIGTLMDSLEKRAKAYNEAKSLFPEYD